MSLILPQFGDDERCFEAIDEVGTSDQNIIDLVTLSNENASSELESLFEGNVDFTVLVSELPDWFRQLAVELQIAYFWVMSNNTDEAKTHREEVRTKANITLEKRFKPSLTLS